jgi:hypothetical protein
MYAVDEATVAKCVTQGETGLTQVERDRYSPIWNQIKRLAPEAILLRGPAPLNPVQASGTDDLDILVPTGLAPVRAFLREQGFHRTYKPQAYLERFRLWVRGVAVPFTIDLYLAERWGWGLRIARNGHDPADPRLACLLDSVADGKGTVYFERRHGGPPWGDGPDEEPINGPIGRALWRTGRTGVLTVYLLLRGVIRPEPSLIVRSLCRRIAYRIWQLIRKTGLEVALLGVDGTGKSSLAIALLRLPAAVKLVYMGPHDYQTWFARFVMEHRSPRPFQQLAYRYDLLVRRVYGWLLARRGWIVVYDRHPAERLEPRQSSLSQRVKNLVDRLYAWPVDLTFWLTGDYPTIYLRKREYSASDLQIIDQRFYSVLEHYGIPFEKIDVTTNDLESVTKVISDQILAEHHERISMEGLPGIFRAILV